MKKEALVKFYSLNKLVIFPVLVALASATLIILVIFPQIKGYFKGQDDIKVTQEKVKVLGVKASELQNIPEADLKSKLQTAAQALPEEKDYTTVIGILQRLAASSGVSLASVNLEGGGGKGVPGVSSFGVKASITGSRLGFDEFVKAVQNAPILMKISAISVDTSGGQDSVAVSLALSVYYSPTPKSLGGIDSPLPKLTEDEEKLAAKLASNVGSTSVVTIPVTGPGEQPKIGEEPPKVLLPRGKENPFE